jgi:putative ABC transport system substrate-binding protein
MFMKRLNPFPFLVAILCTLSTEPLYPQSSELSPERSYHIAITQIVEHPALNQTRQGIIDTLKNEANISKERIHIDYQCAQGSFITATQIAQRLASQKPDLIIAISTSSAQTVKKIAAIHNIPLLFTSVTDPYQAQLMDQGSKSLHSTTPSMITGISNYIEAREQLKFFKQVLPTLRRIGMIYNPSEPNSERLIRETVDAGKEMEIQVVAAAASKTTDLSIATKSLIGKVDALFVNNDNTALSGFESIAKIGLQQGIPTFSSDVDNLPQQALAAYGPNHYHLGVQTGQVALKILAGTSPAQIPLAYPEAAFGQINEQVAQALGLTLSQELESLQKNFSKQKEK